MKYWLLTTEFPPFYGGGISSYCRETAEMMSENGHEVTVFVYDYRVKNTEISRLGKTRVIRFSPDRTDTGGFLGFAASLSYEYAEIIREFIVMEGCPDLVESQDYNAIAYYIQQFKWQGIEPFDNLKIVITCHAPSFICLDYNQVPVYQFPDYWTGEMEKASIKSADLVIFPSRFLRREMEKRLSLPQGNQEVLPNPFFAGGIKEQTPGEPDPGLVVCFGKLSPLKGSFELLKAFKIRWDKGSTLRLFIIGGTDYFFYPERKTMYDLVLAKYRSYLDRKLLVLTGNLPAEEAYSYCKKAKIILVPSLFDNLPYSVIEAMAMGKVVLASTSGGQTEIIRHGQNGFLFDHGKQHDLDEKLDYILQLDQMTYHSIGGQAARTIRENYDPAVIYPEKMALLQNLLSKKEIPEYYPFVFDAVPGVKAMDGGEEQGLVSGGLSVVIPFYNLGDYIEECLVSALESSLAPDEVLIIDDGSTDPRSLAKLGDLEKRYPVRVIYRENQGLSATRNYGASIAKNRFVAFLDADDKIEKSYYAKAVAILERYRNVHFVGCWLNYFGESSGTWPTFNPEPPYILLHNSINSSSLVFERKTFLEEGQNLLSMLYGMEDWETVIRLTARGYRGVAIPQRLFEYRVRKGSMAQSFTREKQLYLYRLIGEKHAGFYGIFAQEIAQILHANGPGIYFDNPSFPVSVAIPLKRLSKIKNKLKQYVKKYPAIRGMAYFIYRKIK